MPNSESVPALPNFNDILVIHQSGGSPRIIFSSGDGQLTQNSKISAQMTQALDLFSQRIAEGEQVHFIRFSNHRMIFLFSQDKSLVATVLIPIDRSARQIIPLMNIILQMLTEFLSGEIIDAQNRQLDCFFQIFSAPREAHVVIPRTSEGILTALVILTAVAHDLQFGIHQVASNIVFVNPQDPRDVFAATELAKKGRVISFLPLPNAMESPNVLIFGLQEPLRQYFSAISGESTYDVVSRIFGEQSNAAKMGTFIANEEAKEIAQSITELPRSEDEFVRTDILLTTVLHPGQDVLVTLSTPVMQKMRDLARSAPSEKTEVAIPDLEGLTVQPSETGTHKPLTAASTPKTFSDASIELAAEPDAIPTDNNVLATPTITPITRATSVDLDPAVMELLEKERFSGLAYEFKSIPVTLDTSPSKINLAKAPNLPFDKNQVVISTFSGDQRYFSIHLYTAIDRLPALKDSLEDLTVRVGGEARLQDDYVLIEGPLEKEREMLRSLLWLGIVEYLTQVQLNLHPLPEMFQIPKKGSILIIPPRREFIREKIPTKFKTFVREVDLRRQFEQESLWSLASAQDEILWRLLQPLKKGEGVVFVCREDNQEMEEIALFLLYVSEICGIGFSRW
ncbi:MAG: hypothetical protein ACFFFG_02925 [Candidatus Thorarchaeota archaeon]